MKYYTFEVTIREERDEWWESNPSDKEVRQMLVDQIETGCMFLVDDKARDFVGSCEVILRKFENPPNV